MDDSQPLQVQHLELLDALFDRTPVGVAVFNPQGRLLRYNHTWAQFIDRYTASTTEEVAAGKALSDLAPGNEERFQDLFARVLAGETVRMDAFRAESQGIVSFWDVVFSPVYQDGHVVAILDVTVDATQRIIALDKAQRAVSVLRNREERLEQNLSALEKLITAISTHLVHMAPTEVDTGINRALEILGEFAEADRSYIFMFSEDGTVIENTHSWAASGIDRNWLPGQGFRVSEFPWINHVLRRGEALHVPSVEFLLPDDSPDRELLTRQGVKSFVVVPMVYGGEPTGILGFDTLEEEHTWAIESVQLLKIAAEFFANALEHKRIQAIQTGQRQFLELLARGGALNETLHTLVRIIEEQWPGILGLVLLLDDDGKHLHHAASASLPQQYLDELEGLEIGPQVGSCGTAAYTAERVIVEDIQTDPRWNDLRDLAMEYGLGACWSQPIISSAGDVMGTFAMYYRHPRLPTDAELRTIEISAHLAGVAIEHKRAQDQLKEAYLMLEQRVAERTRELSSLLDVSYNLASTLDLKALLGVILDQLKTVVDYDGASILELHGDRLRVVAYRGPIPQEEVLQIQFDLKQAGANRRVIEQRQPVIVSDVFASDELAQEFRRTAGKNLQSTFGYVRCWMGVPLIVRGQVVGMLSLDHHEQNCYRPVPHSRLTMAFANQVAVAIENARLYAEAQQRADEAQTLFAVQQAITSRRDPEAVLQMIANEARRLTDTDQGAVYLLEDGRLRVSVISGNVDPSVLGYELDLDSSIAGLAIKSGKPYLISNTGQDERVAADFVRMVGAQSFVIVPLISGSEPVGTITVANRRQGELGPEDERVLTMLATGAVVALENARYIQQEQERRREAERRRQVAEGLRDILSVLNSARPLDEILEYIVSQAVRLLESEAAVLHRLEGPQGPLTIQAAQGLQPEYLESMVIPVGKGVVGQAVVSGHPVVIADTRTAPESLLGPQDDGAPSALQGLLERFKALISVPLVVKDDVYGTVTLYYQEPRDFSDEEVSLSVAFADQAALAIENSRLRAQAERSAVAAERSRLARDLHDAVTQTLFSASLIAEVLPRLWDRKPEEARKRLEELRQLTRGALAEMRTLLLELRPSALIEAEMGELFRHLVDAFTSRARVPVAYSVTGSYTPPPDVKVALYRIAQETLNNVSKHAGATRASLTVICQDRQVSMMIEDNGRGFNPNEVPPDHLGLGIMKERAEGIGAELSLESESGEGTRITVIWQAKER